MTTKQKNEMLQDAMFQLELRENEFAVIDEKGNFKIPRLIHGRCYGCDVYKERPKHYKGLVLEVNDHGNITLWNCFKNGNMREIASQV